MNSDDSSSNIPGKVPYPKETHKKELAPKMSEASGARLSDELSSRISRVASDAKLAQDAKRLQVIAAFTSDTEKAKEMNTQAQVNSAAAAFLKLRSQSGQSGKQFAPGVGSNAGGVFAAAGAQEGDNKTKAEAAAARHWTKKNAEYNICVLNIIWSNVAKVKN